MRQIIIFIYLFLVELISYGQPRPFEGTMTFVTTYNSKRSNISNYTLHKIFGDTTVSIVKKGNYRQRTLNAHGPTDAIYLSARNKYYVKPASVDSLYCWNASIAKSEIISLKEYVFSTNVLGYPCRVLFIKTNTGSIAYYFNNSLPLDYRYFSKHRFGNYDVLTSKTKSIFLKMVFENDDYISTMTAIRINKRPVRDEEFNLPILPISMK